MKKTFFLIFSFFLFPLSAWALDFSAHGNYRLRFYYSHDLDLQRPNPGILAGGAPNESNDRFGTIAYAQQRFRLDPTLKLNDHISLHSELDLFSNTLFGQSEIQSLRLSNPVVGTVILPAANGAFGTLAGNGGDPVIGGGGNILARQMYVDILTSAGKFRIGRQASHFGLGVLSNDGAGEEGDFGDIFDRFLWLAGIPIGNDRFNFGLVYDFAFEATRDPSISGLDRGVNSNWNDTSQAGLIFLYQSEKFELGSFAALRFRDGNDGNPTTTATHIYDAAVDGAGRVDPDTGALLVDGVSGIRKPAGKDGDTLLYTLDIYGRFNFLKYYKIGFEAVYVGGKLAPGVAIDAVVLDDAAQAGTTNPVQDPIELPLNGKQNDVSVFNAAIEFDANWDFGGEAHIKTGFAQGDSSPLSSRITQLGFRPDYDIALLMFNVPLGTSPDIRINGIHELGRKPVSPNYINNAIYLALGYKHTIDISSGVPWAKDFKIGGKFITAWAPSRNLDIDFSQVAGVGSLPHVVNGSRWYGWEFDLSLEATFFEFMHWRSVFGAFFPGGLYDIKNDALSRATAGIIDPIAFDNAEPAFALRTTFTFEF